ncbi:MAG: hypothetical protein OSJ68_02795 [Clostridia bacterium]|nr:hypothetical protein [Clostridia bacterium]
MKIKVKIGKDRREKRGLKRINLAVPNSLLKSRLAVKIIRKGIESKAEEGKTPVISPDYVNHKLLKQLYGCLKTVIKNNGHFNLVEVNASDGTSIVIRI